MEWTPVSSLTAGGGGGAPYDGLYGEASPEKKYLLQALGISKGRDFTSSSIEKGREICHLGL